MLWLPTEIELVSQRISTITMGPTKGLRGTEWGAESLESGQNIQRRSRETAKLKALQHRGYALIWRLLESQR